MSAEPVPEYGTPEYDAWDAERTRRSLIIDELPEPEPRSEQETAAIKAKMKPKAYLPSISELSVDQMKDYLEWAKASVKDFKNDQYEAFFTMVSNLEVKEAVEDLQAGTEPMVLVSEAEVIARPDPEWWLEGFVQKSTICTIAGSGGVGKSFLMLHLARCWALGVPAWQMNTRRARVMYVIAEGASAVGSRARAWDDYHSATVPDGMISYVESGVNLSSKSSVKALAALVASTETDIVIIDTLSQLSGVDDENASAKMAKVYRNLKLIRDQREGATVIVVHHSDAKGTKARGSTAIRDNSDTVVMVRANSAGGFSLSTRNGDGGKQKDGKDQKLDGFKLLSHLTSAVVTHSATKPVHKYWEPVREALADGQAHQTADIREQCGVTGTDSADAKALTRFLGSLVEDGTILRSGPSNRPAYALTMPDIYNQ